MPDDWCSGMSQLVLASSFVIMAQQKVVLHINRNYFIHDYATLQMVNWNPDIRAYWILSSGVASIPNSNSHECIKFCNNTIIISSSEQDASNALTKPCQISPQFRNSLKKVGGETREIGPSIIQIYSIRKICAMGPWNSYGVKVKNSCIAHIKWSKAVPTEDVLASSAHHLSTSTVPFNWHTARWTSLDVGVFSRAK